MLLCLFFSCIVSMGKLSFVGFSSSKKTLRAAVDSVCTGPQDQGGLLRLEGMNTMSMGFCRT